MAKNYRSRLVYLFGCPVDENPTVVMQEAAFAEKGLDWRYITMLVYPGDLENAFLGLRSMNFNGCNLTIPHKIEAIKYMDEISPSAALIGAINTVVVQDGKLIGHNTDGQGMVAGMREAGISLKNKRLVVLGAGGASRAICVECALAGVAEITVINRNTDRGLQIAAVLNQKTNCKGRFIAWEGTAHIPECDILVNATNAGLFPDPSCPDIDYGDINKKMIVQEIIPNPVVTLFIKKAKEQGATTFDGLGMLIHQGIIGFKLWTGEDASRDAMRAALEKV
jgi:shikimate dehydrogenase